ncbi:MAG: type IV pilus assembly protein PilM [Planctomycetes bacterium]|nr:type IV pilus assembly protein PilM [Planctomycetota bacterium]
MESFTVVWGLDIGHTSIKAVKMARSGEDVTVIGYAIEPIPRGEDVDRDSVVQDALKALAEREQINDAPVIVALSGRQIFSRTINVPVLNQNKIGRMVELEAKQQIPGDFNEVEWDYHLSPSIDGASYDVALFAVRRELVQNLVNLCDTAGIDLAGVSVTSLAVYNFVNYDQEFEIDESVVILDVGGENTDLVVYQGDHLWIRNLAFSGDDITKTFQKKFRVSFDEAEKLKMEVNESRQAERIMKVVEGSLGSLTADVQRSLGFYKSQNTEAKFENIVVSGNTFRMEALSSYLANQLEYPIITLVELDRIGVDPSLPHEQFLDDVQSLSTAIGLGLQGVGVANASVNLLPSNIRLQGILRAKRWAAISILALIAISIGVSYTVKAQRAD